MSPTVGGPLADANSAAVDTTSLVTVIEAGRAERRYWADLWRYRELLGFLSWRDIAVRYKQAVFGVAWAVVRPLLTMVVFTVVFHRIAKLESNDVPYPIVVYTAMLPWQFFSSALAEASASLIGNSNLISKVYFPRVIVPLSAVVVSMVDFAVSAVILVLMMALYRYSPDWRIVVLPFFLAIATFAATGAGLLLAALTVEYRDFRYVVPFIVQFGLYISPVGFKSSVVPDRWRLLYSLNPMTGVIDGFRWCLTRGGEPLYLPGLVAAIAGAVILTVLGAWYFRRTERSFADMI